jgi:hypothetical protein
VSSEAAREIVQRLRTNPTPDVIAAAADVIEALITMQNKLAEVNNPALKGGALWLSF